MELDHELEIATTLANQAGAVVRRACGEILRHGTSLRPGDILALADLVTETVILAGLERAFPADAVYAEQSSPDTTRRCSGRLWLVDVLDGLSSLLSGENEHAISIGLAVAGRAAVGVVYNPARNQLFAGTAFRATVLNGAPVGIPATWDWHSAQFGLPWNEWERLDRAGSLSLALYPTQSVSYRLARVAAGLDDGFFCLRALREWTTCAGTALLQASGMVAALHGSAEVIYNGRTLRHPTGIVAAPRQLHSLLSDAVPGLLQTPLPPPSRSIA